MSTEIKATRVDHYTNKVSHWIHIDHQGGIKETVRLYFRAPWRGIEVNLTMEADRYTHSSGLSEWRIHTDEARQAMPGTGLAPEVTDTAKKRCGDACRQQVEDFLKSEEYARSEAGAYYDAIKRMIRELRPYSDEPSREVRQQIERFALKLSVPMAERLLALCYAFDRLTALFNAPLPE